MLTFIIFQWWKCNVNFLMQNGELRDLKSFVSFQKLNHTSFIIFRSKISIMRSYRKEWRYCNFHVKKWLRFGFCLATLKMLYLVFCSFTRTHLILYFFLFMLLGIFGFLEIIIWYISSIWEILIFNLLKYCFCIFSF